MYTPIVCTPCNDIALVFLRLLLSTSLKVSFLMSMSFICSNFNIRQKTAPSHSAIVSLTKGELLCSFFPSVSSFCYAILSVGSLSMGSGESMEQLLLIECASCQSPACMTTFLVPSTVLYVIQFLSSLLLTKTP